MKAQHFVRCSHAGYGLIPSADRFASTASFNRPITVSARPREAALS